MDQRHLAAAAFALALLLVGGAAGAQESRCSQLGTDCICSEPLDNSDTVPPTATPWDPSDSPPASDCTDVPPSKVFYQSGGSMVTGCDLESYGGTDPPATCLRTTGSFTQFFGAENITQVRPNAERYCTRWYMRYGNAYECPSKEGCPACLCTDDGKILDWSGNFGTNNHQWVINDDISCPAPGTCGASNIFKVDTDDFPVPNDKFFLQGGMTPDDCRADGAGNGGWCRWEFCVAGSGVNTPGGQKYVDVRIHQLDPPFKTGFQTSTPLTYASAHLTHHVNVWNDQSGDARRVEFTHFMEAAWDSDAGQLIGAAPEIEGGSGPAISIAIIPLTQQIISGTTANWAITVTNTGDETLTSVTVTSPLAPDCDRALGTFTPGQESTYGCSEGPGVTEDFTNVATVVGTPPSSPDVNDQASGVVDVISPSISIAKTPDQDVVSGGTATWTITVTNTGDAPLSAVTVTDPLAPDCNASLGTLAPSEVVPYGCSLASVSTSFTNTASVSGQPPVGFQVTDNDSAEVTLISPSISIAKTPASQQILVGGTANFTVTVTNTGDSNLDSVTVTDPLAPDCDNAIGTMTPSQVVPYACSLASVGADFTNAASVTGTPSAGPVVNDQDTALVDVTAPAITIVKLPATQEVVSGGTAGFTVRVTNTGDVNLDSVAVTDPLAADCDSSLGTLTPSQMVEYFCEETGVTSPFTNTASVAGTPPVGPNATDQDTADVTVGTPGPSPAATGAAVIIGGGE